MAGLHQGYGGGQPTDSRSDDRDIHTITLGEEKSLVWPMGVSHLVGIVRPHRWVTRAPDPRMVTSECFWGEFGDGERGLSEARSRDLLGR